MERAVKPGRRPYRTRLRQEQADLTRARILAAARELFVERGFGEVTMQDIAAVAGVAYQTLYSQFGNKLQLALVLCSSELPHVGPTVALLATAREGGDPVAWVEVLGAFARRLYEPCAEILRFMRESGDAELLGRYREIGENRRRDLSGLGRQLQRSGRLRPGVTGQEAEQLAWTLTSPETYQQLVLDQGWSPDRFEAWLGPALAGLLLADA